MIHRHLTCKECEIHSILAETNTEYENRICGCPRTKRTNGLYIYRNDNTGNWVVWDVRGKTWLSLAGSWQTAMNSANLYLKYRRDNPGENWGISVNSAI